MNKPLLVYNASVLTSSGYGAKSRTIAKALIELKSEDFDVQILPTPWGNTPWTDDVDQIIKDHINMTGQLPKQPDVWIQDTISPEFKPIGKYNIGITSGIETDIS